METEQVPWDWVREQAEAPDIAQGMPEPDTWIRAPEEPLAPTEWAGPVMEEAAEAAVCGGTGIMPQVFRSDRELILPNHILTLLRLRLKRKRRC